MINKIEFSARNLTSNAGLFLLLDHANKNGIFDVIDHDRFFENASANKIKMNHIKTILCDSFIFTNHTSLSSEEVIEFYEKSGNCENYIKEAKYDMAVGHLLLKSFWSNEAIFELMMLAYNLFLLFKMDFAGEAEYRQQIKTFQLKYVFLAGKIFRTAKSVVMKLSEKYPYQELIEKSLS